MTNPKPKNPIPLKDRKLYQKTRRRLDGASRVEEYDEWQLCDALRDAWAVALEATWWLDHEKNCVPFDDEMMDESDRCVHEREVPADWQAEAHARLMEGEDG